LPKNTARALMRGLCFYLPKNRAEVSFVAEFRCFDNFYLQKQISFIV
jgi:hypothetical protein